MRKSISIASALVMALSALSVGGVSAAAEASVSGYAAVGEVEGTTAAVLLGDGTKAEVTFTGTAPESGAVYAYTQTNDVYTFEEVEVNKGLSQQLSNDSPEGAAEGTTPGAWSLYVWPWQGFNIDGTLLNRPGEYFTYRITADAPIFIR